MQCIFTNGVCSRPGCHRVNKSGVPDSELKAQCRFVCGHLLEAIGEEVEVICTGCKGAKYSRWYPVHGCKVHGECLPAFQCTKESKEATAEWMEQNGRSVEIAVCYGCEDSTEFSASNSN